MASPLQGKQGFPAGKGDSRNDLGYGRLTQKYFRDRIHGDPTFPYVEPATDTEDVDVDDEAIAAVHDKLQEPRNYDPLPYADTFGSRFRKMVHPPLVLLKQTTALSCKQVFISN